MHRLRFGLASLSVLGLIVVCGWAHAGDNWPQWRGPEASGVSDSTGLPVEWDAEKNVVWKAALPSWASSTPIIWDGRVYVVSPSKVEPVAAPEPNDGAGNRRGRGNAVGDTHPEGGEKILLMAFSLDDGSPLWQGEAAGQNKMFRKHNASTPSPVTDGQHIWMVTGSGMITAFDMSGQRKWHFDLAEQYGEMGARHGYASSPVVHEGRVYVQVVHGYSTDGPSYVMAFDGATGEIAWHKERATDAGPRTESRDAYTTPLVMPVAGRMQLAVVGANFITGHDLATGEELWRMGGLNPDNHHQKRLVASSMLVDGRLYVPSRKGPILAFDSDRMAGDAGDALLWQYNEGTLPDVPSAVTDGVLLYLANDGGAVSCLDAATGELVWGPEETGLGTTSASLVAADGKLYLTGESSVTAVMAMGREFKMLAMNRLDGSYTLASPAISGNRMLLRTAEHLYCIANQ